MVGEEEGGGMGSQEEDLTSGTAGTTNLPDLSAVQQAVDHIYEDLCSLCDALSIKKPPRTT